MAFYDHHFQRRGGDFLGRWKDNREDRKLLELVLGLHPCPRLVEVGPGIGHFAVACQLRGIDYEAVEPNETQARYIESLGFRVHRALTPPLPLPDEHCDVFYASQVIEHMPGSTAAVEFVKEARRVVRPGGWIVLTAPDISSWREFFWEDYTHAFPTTPRRLVTMFEDLELKQTRVHRYCSSFFGPARHLFSVAGALLPYRLLEALTGASLRRGVLFNLKAATLTRFLIAGRVPLTRDAAAACAGSAESGCRASFEGGRV